MNWFDILLAAILITSVIEGVRLGFARVMIGMAALVAGLLAAAWFYGAVAAYLAPYIRSRPLAHLTAFFLILMLVQALGALVGWVCAKVFRWTGLGWLDRLLGLAAGALRAAVAAVILVLVFSAFDIRLLRDALAGSRAAPYLLDSAQVLVSLCPRELRDDFSDAYGHLRELWKKRLPARRPPADSV
ncbi:MAG: CvpA family protein [Bryobacteraceae bacterium]|nr:CvpA family protein [Bryobacteraceae bacterium]